MFPFRPIYSSFLPLAAAFCFLGTATAWSREIPKLGGASEVHANVPTGKLTEGVFKDSKVYPGTERKWAVYVPSQYDAAKPACALVFLDGSGYLSPKGHSRATVVLDNLIAEGKLPVTVAIFIDPGTVPSSIPGGKGRSTRSYEYDSPTPLFSEFLASEMLPLVRKQVNLTTDAAGWGICGISSSSVAAFQAAWERPDLFSKVVSYIGSFTNIRGGYHYPALIRKSAKAPKPIRMWMQEGEADLDNLHGCWPLANEDMAAALKWAGYDYQFVMTGGGHSGQGGGALLPDALTWLFRDYGKAAEPAPAKQAEPKKPDGPKVKRHADAEPKAAVAKGQINDMGVFKSTIFSGTERAWQVFTSANYKPDGTAAVMIFQDGHDYVNPNGAWGVTNVIDNLTASEEIPPMVAIFLDPGHDPSKPRKNAWSNSNRSLEYDGQGERYAKFLIEEILPAVQAKWPVSSDPAMRGLCGASSGGICAFNAAWERPDQFRRVLSTIGSFVNLRGGERLAYLVRKTAWKPLRVFQQDSSGDLDNPFGHWPTANKILNTSLNYMGYDAKLDFVEGFGHNSQRGGEIFPDAMRWLWRKEAISQQPGKVKDDLAGDMTLNKILIPGEDWTEWQGGLGFVDGLSVDATGTVFFNDLKAGGFWKASKDGKKEKVSEDNGSGAKIGPDGRWYFCQGKLKRLVARDTAGNIDVMAENVQPNDLVVTPAGWIYFTQTGKGEVVSIEIKSKTVKVAASGIKAPNGIGLSPTADTLIVSEYQGNKFWAYRVNPDGSLDAGMPYMTPQMPVDDKLDSTFNEPPPYKAASGGDGLCSDSVGRYYVTTTLGLQIFDPTGRECGLVPLPAGGKPAVSVTVDSPNGFVYVAQEGRIWRRKITVN